MRPYRNPVGECVVCGESYYANTHYDGVHYHDKYGVCSGKCWQIKSKKEDKK